MYNLIELHVLKVFRKKKFNALTSDVNKSTKAVTLAECKSLSPKQRNKHVRLKENNFIERILLIIMSESNKGVLLLCLYFVIYVTFQLLERYYRKYGYLSRIIVELIHSLTKKMMTKLFWNIYLLFITIELM